MVTNESKQQMVEALQKLSAAMNEVNELWGEKLNLDEWTEHGKKYPFIQSFDEVSAEVGNWVDHAVDEINAL